MKKVLLVILDGVGEAPAGPGNAVRLAQTPHFDALRQQYPYGLLQACGEAVGLVEGSMGGSEVGHFTMGAGRVVPQFLLMINRAIQDGSFFRNPALQSAFEHAKKTGNKLHLIGMISDKGVHAHIDHLFALIEWAKREGLSRVYIHAIADGRDVEERSVKRYLKQLQAKIHERGVGKIATLVGRYFAMDRDTNWDRTEKAYRLMTLGEGDKFENPETAVESFYQKDPTLTDYYLLPILIDPEGLVETDDAVIFFNYRTDRTRQLTAAFTEPDFKPFKPIVGKVHFVCMGPYSSLAPVAFDIPPPENNLAVWLSKHQVRQLRVAETEKYAHVTYFFNSQVEEPVALEDRILVPSHKVSSYAEKPEMSAPEITEKVLGSFQKSEHPVIIVNYANGDLVGHSGNLQATIKAMETLDECVGRLYEQAMKSGYTLMLTADHGNADDMLYPNGSPRPAHSMNPVLFLVADPEGKIRRVENGGLADVAPTLLKILGLPKPAEMAGRELV